MNGGEAGAPGPDGDLVENPRAVRARRGCAGPNRARRDAPGRGVGGCDYYDSDEPQIVEGAPAAAPASEPASPAAKIAAPSGPKGEVDSFSSHVSDELEQQLVDARKNWHEKKQQLGDANSDWAQAQREADRTGNAVDSGAVARQASAQQEADAARAAMVPLAEQARESGMSPALLDMYMQ